MADDFAITTVGLTKKYGDFTAVDRLNLQVYQGNVFGLLGPNGSGKTTTIRMLLGLSELTSGTANVLGYDLNRHPHRIREKVGVLLDNHGLYERLTVQDNLDYYGRIYRLSLLEIRKRSEELLRRFGLWEWRAETVSKLSTGMKQKVAFTRLLLHRPPLIILDEPTAGLDAGGALALREDIMSLSRSEWITVFLTTHNLAEAERLCDRVAILNQGRLVASGTPDEVKGLARKDCLVIRGRNFSDEALLAIQRSSSVSGLVAQEGELIIELAGAVSVAPIVSMLVLAGAEIEGVDTVGPSLEEAFLVLCGRQQLEQ